MRLFRIDAVQLSGFHRSRSPIDIVPGRQPKVAICVIWRTMRSLPRFYAVFRIVCYTR